MLCYESSAKQKNRRQTISHRNKTGHNVAWICWIWLECEIIREAVQCFTVPECHPCSRCRWCAQLKTIRQHNTHFKRYAVEQLPVSIEQKNPIDYVFIVHTIMSHSAFKRSNYRNSNGHMHNRCSAICIESTTTHMQLWTVYIDCPLQ